MGPYTSGDASRAARGMVVFDQEVRKILKKAKKLERKYEALIAKADKIKEITIMGFAISRKPMLKAMRVRRSYMNLAKKFPHVVK